MRFCTIINCMDGRTQLPAIQFALERFNAQVADSITEPGPNKILAEQQPEPLYKSLLSRLDISLNNHSSCGVVIVGHHDCAGNPAGRKKQEEQLRKAVKHLYSLYEGVDFIPIWVNHDWEVCPIIID
jgi:carbonic anhydrase